MLRGQKTILALMFFILNVASTPAPVEGERAIVVSAEPLATEAGIAVLASGGNVVDAAVAVSLVLAVVEPWASGLGGGGLAVLMQDGRATSFDMREVAPGEAHREMFLKDGVPIPKASVASADAAAIPGLVRGLAGMHKLHGRLPFEQLVQPAYLLAKEGFPVPQRLRHRLEKTDRLTEEAKKIFMPGGELPEVGTTLVQQDLAEVLARIGASYGEDFYVGETAKLLVAANRKAGGRWRAGDLEGYQVKEREVLRGRFRGKEVLSMGPPSSGGLLLLQMLGVVERLEMGEGRPEEAWRGAGLLHQRIEIMKRAFAMRALRLADPDFVPFDAEAWFGEAVVERLAAEVAAQERATAAETLSPLRVIEELPHTSHFSVVDAEGNGVAMTQTINLWFGNGDIAEGTGIIYNNEMDDFAIAPGVPNAFGMVGDEANAPEPGKRPLSSMTPTLVVEDGRVRGSFGSPGGSTIITTVFQTLLHVIDDGLDAAEALAAPRLHEQWYPERVKVERMLLAPEVRRVLEDKGHVLEQSGPIGNAMVIWKTDDGRLTGAADPRGRGVAMGL